MTYPILLLHLDDDARADARNAQAVRFARRLGSHLDGLSCRRPVPTGAEIGAGLGALADALTMELQLARERAAAREAAFRALCERLRQASFKTLVDEDEEPGRALLRQAPVHDLVVLGQPDPSEPLAAQRRGIVNEVVLHSPRPTLLLPYAGTFDEIGRQVLVAWDGSHGAARAAADALPLLRRADAVHLVFFDRHARATGTIDQTPLHGALRWLERHGVAAAGRVAFTRADIGNALLSHAADVGADLLVMGSWGQAPWTERLLGGATRTVMSSMTLPVLTSR